MVTTKSVIRKSPAKSVKFECRNDAEYIGEFSEASSISRGEDLPVLHMCDASLDCGPNRLDGLVVSFVADGEFSALWFLARRDREGSLVSRIGDYRDLRESIFPATLGEGLAVMNGTA